MLHSADELLTELGAGRVFAGWQTTPPTFKPTFKLTPGLRKCEYDRKRVPSWCDRVLWKSLPGAAGCIEQYEYVACPNFVTSDHKPVRAAFRIQIPKTAANASASLDSTSSGGSSVPPSPAASPASKPSNVKNNGNGGSAANVKIIMSDLKATIIPDLARACTSAYLYKPLKYA